MLADLRAMRSYISMQFLRSWASQTDTSWSSIQNKYGHLIVCIPLPPHTILQQDALHRFEYPFLCSICSIFQWVTFPKYILTSFLTFLQPLHMLRRLLPKER